MQFTYRNKSDQHLVIPNVGEVAPGDIIHSEFKLENQHLEEVGSQQTELLKADEHVEEKK